MARISGACVPMMNDGIHGAELTAMALLGTPCKATAFLPQHYPWRSGKAAFSLFS